MSSRSVTTEAGNLEKPGAADHIGIAIPARTGYGFGFPVTTAGLLMVPSGLALVVFAPCAAR